MRATDDRAARKRSPGQAPATKSGPTDRRLTLKWILLVLWVLIFLIAHLAGCGYTVLEHPESGPGPASGGAAGTGRQLPPGHPPIDELLPLQEETSWEGRSFLDALVGEEDPLRFENVRNDRSMQLPSQHSQITLRMTLGGPAVSDIWQVRVDEHGWVVVAHWTQALGDFELDDTQATERAEYRLARASESALRAMLLAMMPMDEDRRPRIPEIELRDVPPELWTFDESGLLELSYRIETLDGLTAEEWPGGAVTAPLELVQVLLGTWSSAPPPDLRDLVQASVTQHPLLVDLAMMVEGVILAWEVEGPEVRTVELPLHVGR